MFVCVVFMCSHCFVCLFESVRCVCLSVSEYGLYVCLFLSSCTLFCLYAPKFVSCACQSVSVGVLCVCLCVSEAV